LAETTPAPAEAEKNTKNATGKTCKNFTAEHTETAENFLLQETGRVGFTPPIFLSAGQAPPYVFDIFSRRWGFFIFMFSACSAVSAVKALWLQKKKTSSNVRPLDVFRRGEKFLFPFFVIGNNTIATLTPLEVFAFMTCL
jgi:hypothetical protein